jgi:hypothetical protein
MSFEEPPRTFCESHEHDMSWWAYGAGQYEVCRNCAFAVVLPDREPIETEWMVLYDGVTGEPKSAMWLPAPMFKAAAR